MSLFKKRWLYGGALILWMGVIFAFSHQPGSGTNWEPPLWYVLERKSAHLVEYGILMGLGVMFFQSLYPRATPRQIFLSAFLLAFVYGFTDEIHQAFIFGRGAKFSDALIDGVGALGMGILMWWWQSQIRGKQGV